jgi:uncharacterized protein YndB with AHSA1/START domain
MPDNHPIADGTVDKGPDGSTRIRFVRRLPHPVERVWEALTDPAEIRKWWGDADLDLTDGGRFTLRWLNTDDQGNAALLDGTISKLDPPRFLEISGTWGSTAANAPATQTTVTWELDPDGDHTLLQFTNTIPGPPDHPGTTDLTTTDTITAAGWHLHLDALATALSGDRVAIAHPEPLFEPIHKAYTEHYGPGSRAGSGPESGPGAGSGAKSKSGAESDSGAGAGSGSGSGSGFESES